MNSQRRWTVCAINCGAIAVAGLILCGCRLAQSTVQLPEQAVRKVLPASEKPLTDPAELQGRVQRFADDFNARTIQALDEYSRCVGTSEAASQALRWKLDAATASVGIAAGANPQASLVEMLAMVSLNRRAIEEYRGQSTNGPAIEPWLASSRTLESNLWQLAARVFKPEQQREIREAIARWQAENPALRGTFFVSPEEFSAMVARTAENRSGTASVFRFIGLDPVAGLDPAVQEVTRTRLFAERAMFTFQHMPLLARWHVEVLVQELVSKPGFQLALTNSTILAESADRISRTAAELPDRITIERQEILHALEDQEGKLRDLAAEMNATLAAGEKMSTSLNATLTTFDALMKRFGVGEPGRETARDTNAPPFDILNYARTAEQLAVTARELDALLKDFGATLDSPAWNRRLQDFDAVSQRASGQARSVLNHAFLLGAGLILLAFACAIVYRKLFSRREASR